MAQISYNDQAAIYLTKNTARVLRHDMIELGDET
jgi:hypothetical protein